MFSSPHLQKIEIKIEQGKKQQNRNKGKKKQKCMLQNTMNVKYYLKMLSSKISAMGLRENIL